ncbi:MAG: hypothetical protein ACWGOY_15380, partial [Anaerolineales bacterium]
NAVHNGPQGTLSWGAMLVIATSMGEFFLGITRNRRYFGWLSIAILTLGSLLVIYALISKHRASASYMLVSLGLSGLIFFAFHILNRHYRVQIPLLADFGKNPLLLYLLHGLFLALFVLPPFPVWYFEAPLWLVAIQAVIFVAVLSWIVRFFNRKSWYLTI